MEQNLDTHLNRMRDLTGSLVKIPNMRSGGTGFDDDDKLFLTSDIDFDGVVFLLFVSLTPIAEAVGCLSDLFSNIATSYGANIL